jgi:mannosyltransferase
MMRRPWLWVGSLTVLGAALRFATLDAKGFWADEASTVREVRSGFGDMLSRVVDNEVTPPLYTILAWLWQRPFGDGEVAVRSLPALFGTATIPLAYLAGRELVSRRAGVVTAALVAVNPLLIWYSQEARAYSLLVLLCTLGLYFFARALREPRRNDLFAWAGVSSLALATHHFALFIVAAEGGWLLRTHPRIRELRWALAVPAAVGLALAPLLLHQYFEHAEGLWIADISLSSRAAQVPGFFLVGFELPWPEALAAAAAAAAPVGLGLLLLRRAPPRERRGALTAGGLAAVTVGAPLVLAVVGLDVFLYRNVLPALVPAAIAVAAGFAAAGRLGAAAAGGLCALSLGVVLATGWTPKYRRDTWREASAAIGRGPPARAIVATPNGLGEARTLMVYLDGLRRVQRGSWRLREVVAVALPRRPLGSLSNPRLPRSTAPHPPAGFAVVERRWTDDFVLVRYRSRYPRRVTVTELTDAALDDGTPGVLTTD